MGCRPSISWCRRLLRRGDPDARLCCCCAQMTAFHSTASSCFPISFTQMNGNSRDILRLWLWQLLRAAFGGGTLCTVEPFYFGGCDHATDQASFDAKARRQNRRRQCAGCRRTRFLAGRQRIRIDSADCRYPASRQELARSSLRSRRRGNGRCQPRHVLSLRQGKYWRRRRADRPRMRRLRPWLRRLSRLRRLPWLWRLPWLRRMPGLRRMPRLRRIWWLRDRDHWLCRLCWLRRLLPVLGHLPLVLGPAARQAAVTGLFYPTRGMVRGRASRVCAARRMPALGAPNPL
jgi:hypothetical protein